MVSVRGLEDCVVFIELHRIIMALVNEIDGLDGIVLVGRVLVGRLAFSIGVNIAVGMAFYSIIHVYIIDIKYYILT